MDNKESGLQRDERENILGKENGSRESPVNKISWHILFTLYSLLNFSCNFSFSSTESC